MKPLIDYTSNFRNSLRFKLIVGSILVEIVMLALMIANNLRQSSHHLEELTRARTVELAETFSIALTPALAARDFASLRSLNERLVALPDVLYLVVLDQAGHQVASAGSAPVPLPPPRSDIPANEMVFHAVSALDLFGQVYGNLHYGLSLAELRTAETNLLRQGILIAAAEITLSLLALSWITILLTERLEDLTRASVRLASGDLETLVSINGKDEVAALSAAFNTMSVAIREQFQRLEDNAAVLRRSNAELARMAEVMAHHIQEPLRTIVSYSQLIERRHGASLGDEGHEFLGYVVEGALRMKRLLIDLQTYAAVDVTPRAGGTAIDLGACMAQVHKELGSRLAQADAELVVDSLPSVVGDEEQIRQAFFHLIDNAIEHRIKENPLRISVYSEPWENGHLITVSDNGPGIPARYQQQVFRLFERLGSATQGTGVGLAMVRKIVESHGGRIWIEDNVPHGLVVRFSLPAHIPTSGVGMPSSARPQPLKQMPDGDHDDARLQHLIAEAARSEERYRLLLKTASDGIHVLDAKGNLLEASDAFLGMLGYQRHQAVGLNVSDWEAMLSHETLLETTLPNLLLGPVVFETRHRRADGSLLDVEVNARPVELGGISYIYASSRDITERKNTMANLRAATSRLRLVIETAAEGIFGIDDEGRIMFANTATATLLGLSGVEDLLGKQSSDALGHFLASGESCRHNVCAMRSTLVDGITRRVDNEFFASPAGKPIPVEYVVSPLLVEDIIVGAVVAFHDITERRGFEAELERSRQQLEEFAYAASHDMREPLRMVSAYLGLLDRREGNSLSVDGREFLDFAKDGALRLDRMILGLLDYSRIGHGPISDQAVSLDQVVDEAGVNLGPTVAEGKATIHVASPLPTVRGNHGELVRLIQNLLANALKYRSAERRPEITVTASFDHQNWVISVSDNGVGIPADQTERIFVIFQRLHGKEVDGCGIGLASCKRIVEHHGGRIWAESEVGRGSTFFFTLQDETAAN